jgi:hypothetical protein
LPSLRVQAGVLATTFFLPRSCCQSGLDTGDQLSLLLPEQPPSSQVTTSWISSQGFWFPKQVFSQYFYFRNVQISCIQQYIIRVLGHNIGTQNWQFSSQSSLFEQNHQSSLAAHPSDGCVCRRQGLYLTVSLGCLVCRRCGGWVLRNRICGSGRCGKRSSLQRQALDVSPCVSLCQCYNAGNPDSGKRRIKYGLPDQIRFIPDIFGSVIRHRCRRLPVKVPVQRPRRVWLRTDEHICNRVVCVANTCVLFTKSSVVRSLFPVPAEAECLCNKHSPNGFGIWVRKFGFAASFVTENDYLQDRVRVVEFCEVCH